MVTRAMHHAVGDEFMHARHIMLDGPIGSGKRFAARLIAKCLHALGVTGSDTANETSKVESSETVRFIDVPADSDRINPKWIAKMSDDIAALKSETEGSLSGSTRQTVSQGRHSAVARPRWL